MKIQVLFFLLIFYEWSWDLKKLPGPWSACQIEYVPWSELNDTCDHHQSKKIKTRMVLECNKGSVGHHHLSLHSSWQWQFEKCRKLSKTSKNLNFCSEWKERVEGFKQKNWKVLGVMGGGRWLFLVLPPRKMSRHLLEDVHRFWTVRQLKMADFLTYKPMSFVFSL